MKKIIFVLSAAVLLAVNSNAQEATEAVATTTTTTSTSGASNGKFAIDVNFNPAAFFDAAANEMFEMPIIKGRYFISSDMAVRLGLGFNSSGEKEYLDVDGEIYGKGSSSMFTFIPGIEKQIKFEKLELIIGGQVPIMVSSSKGTAVTPDETITLKNQDGTDKTVIGINAVIGFNYYVLPNLYFGAELAPGFAYTKFKDVKDVDSEIISLGGSSNSFSLGSTSGLVIGVRF